MVYVDDAGVSKYGRDWFHLTADSLVELHAFAANINIYTRAFHRGARHPHYDITESQRLRALRGGASPVTARDIVRITRKAAVLGTSQHAPVDASQLPLFV